MRSIISTVCVPLLFAHVAACSSDSEDTSQSIEEPTYSLTLESSIQSTDGVATFISATASPHDIKTAEIIGKPWYMAFFEAGSEPGVDAPIHAVWGEIGEDMEISYTTPSIFAAGPHDAVLVMYVEAEVTEADKDEVFAPMAIAGDLASFTLAEQVLREGDPELHLAFLRFQVDNKDASMLITNELPTDWNDDEQLLNAYINTILVVP